jgi:PPOX class probable F420-dependent enzyme
MLINPDTNFGQRVLRRLQQEEAIWLTTVGADGTPQPNPVWFVWENETFLIYTQPDSHKLRHIARNPQVSLNFEGREHVEDVVVFTGEVRIETDVPPANTHSVYVEKYKDDIARLDMDPEKFAGKYSVALRVTPKKLRGF